MYLVTPTDALVNIYDGAIFLMLLTL